MSREMKDSGIPWIGEIPKDWEVKPTKCIFDVIAGATPKSDNDDFWDGNIPWITPADYKTEDRSVSAGRRFLTQKGLESCATTLLPTGSVIFSKRAPIGLVVINSQPVCTNQGCLGCIPRTANSVFFYYAMSVFKEQYELYGSGTTFKEISATNFADFRLPYPKIAEQQRIAEFLDKKCGEVDEMIALQEQIIEELKAYKQSVITEAVTKGLNPNVPMKDSGIEWIGEIPEHWEVKRLKYLCLIQTGNKDTQDADKDGEYPFYVRSPLIERSTTYSFDGAGAGRVFHHAYGKYAVHQRVYRLSNIIDINSDYLFYYISNLFTKVMDMGSAQSTVPSVRLPMLTNFRVCLPQVDEQQAIAEYLDKKCNEIDNLISIKQQKIESLKEYKKSIIYEYVTGKKEVE